MFDVRGRIANCDAARLYLNMLKCYFIFVSFFSLFLFLKKSSTLATNHKYFERRQWISKFPIKHGGEGSETKEKFEG